MWCMSTLIVNKKTPVGQCHICFLTSLDSWGNISICWSTQCKEGGHTVNDKCFKWSSYDISHLLNSQVFLIPDSRQFFEPQIWILNINQLCCNHWGFDGARGDHQDRRLHHESRGIGRQALQYAWALGPDGVRWQLIASWFKLTWEKTGMRFTPSLFRRLWGLNCVVKYTQPTSTRVQNHSLCLRVIISWLKFKCSHSQWKEPHLVPNRLRWPGVWVCIYTLSTTKPWPHLVQGLWWVKNYFSITMFFFL